MPDILKMLKDNTELINQFFNKRYFLCTIGSIFLLGIVAQMITNRAYIRLIKKSENMVSPKSKILKQIKMKFENSRAVNGVVANSTIMVERYINKYKILGISLGKMSRITNVCEVLCLFIGGVSGYLAYEVKGQMLIALTYVLVGAFMAYMLDVFSRSLRIDLKEKELLCIITDFLENTLNCKERRQERTARTLLSLKKMQENGTDADDRERKRLADEDKERKVDLKDKFVVNYEPDLIHTDLNGDNEMDVADNDSTLTEKELIINQVLAEFL